MKQIARIALSQLKNTALSTESVISQILVTHIDKNQGLLVGSWVSI
jgi:hypothetical protein